MWCLETIVRINDEHAKVQTAYEAYENAGIRVLGNTKRNADGPINNPAVPTGNVGNDDDDVAS